MNNSNTIQQFHSGLRLKKLRELQGISINELATELDITAAVLESWEINGVPNDETITQ